MIFLNVPFLTAPNDAKGMWTRRQKAIAQVMQEAGDLNPDPITPARWKSPARASIIKPKEQMWSPVQPKKPPILTSSGL
jgi:hypothetical protein